jgi:HEAT repeat protein
LRRFVSITLRVLAVTVPFAAATLPVRAEGPPDVAGDLRLAARRDAPLADRVAAVRRILDARRTGDVDGTMRAAAALVAAAPIEAARLVAAARDEGVPHDDATDAVRAAVDAELGRAPEAARDALLLVGLATGRIPAEPAEQARVIALLRGPGGPPAREVVAATAPTLASVTEGSAGGAAEAFHAERLLETATATDPAVSRPALEELVRRGVAGDPHVRAALAATASLGDGASSGSRGTPKGRVPRRVRAILALGMVGDRGARPILEAALDDHEDGWVRVGAATALGDLGDPAAAPALANVLFYLGDVHRLRDAWEYPGAGNTEVAEADWNDVEYFAIDVAAADALLRLGVREAAGWLLQERLRVASSRWRVRVLQDATDAIRRAFPAAPRGYEPDAGVPDRHRAWEALVAWWATGPRLARPLDEADPGFRAAADELVAVIGRKAVMNLQIAKRSAGLLGPPMTPAVLAGLAASTSRVHRSELALVLGTLRDRRAVDPLLALTRDPTPSVRSSAAEALAAYVDGERDPAFDGAAPGVLDRAVARWIEMLSDEEESARASAMKGLVSAPPREDVRAAVAAHASATHAENAFSDFAVAEEVVTAVQTGAGLDRCLARLGAPELYVRRATWEHLARALRLDPRAFDPGVDPTAPGTVSVALRSTLEAALARRRGA